MEKNAAKIIQEKGKGFTIFYDMFRDIDVIIEWGANFDPDSESLDNMDHMYVSSFLLAVLCRWIHMPISENASLCFYGKILSKWLLSFSMRSKRGDQALG